SRTRRSIMKLGWAETKVGGLDTKLVFKHKVSRTEERGWSWPVVFADLAHAASAQLTFFKREGDGHFRVRLEMAGRDLLKSIVHSVVAEHIDEARDGILAAIRKGLHAASLPEKEVGEVVAY